MSKADPLKDEYEVRFRVPRKLYFQLKQAALDDRRSITSYVLLLLEKHLSEEDADAQGPPPQGVRRHGNTMANVAGAVPGGKRVSMEDQACERVRISIRCPDTLEFRKWCVGQEQKGLVGGMYDSDWYKRGEEGEWDLDG